MSDLVNQDIRRSLTLLVTVAVLPLLLLAGTVAWLLVDQRQAAVLAELTGTVRALQVAVDRELASQQSAMDVLTTAASLHAGDLPAFSERVRKVLALHHDWLSVSLIDPQTRAIVASGLALPDPPPLASSPDEVDTVVRTGQPVAVGVLPSGRLLKQPFVQFLAPVRVDGRLRYVLSVALDPGVLSAVFADQGMDPTWTGAIVDGRMRIAGRSRDADRFIGKVVTPTLASRITAGERGLFPALNQEGATVYTALSRSPATGWTVAIGVPAQYVEGPVRALLIALALGAVALVALSLSLTGIVGRGIVRRRKAYEKALDDARVRLDAAVSGAEMATWEMDLPRSRLVTNDRGANLLGYGHQPLPFSVEDWEAMIHPDDLTRVRSALGQHLAGTAPSYEAEYRLRHRQGHWLWVLARGKVTERDDAGRPLLAMGTALDVSQRKNADAAAERDRARLQTILATASDGIHIVDADGLLVEANPAFLGMLGHDRSALGQLRVTDWDADISIDDFRRHNTGLLATGGSRFFETRHRRRDGSVFDVEISATRMDVDGRWYLCAASRDITMRKRTEAQLAEYRDHLEDLVASRTHELAAARDAAEAASRAKSTFLANMSHELRTPMNAIIGLTGLMQGRATEPQQRDHLGKTMNAARHLLAIINDILDLSKIEAEALILRPADFSLSRALTDAVQMVAEAAQAKGLQLEQHLAADLPDRLHGDGVRLTQIVVNFLGNAIKFSARGTVRLEARCLRNDGLGVELRLEVSDEGEGISPALQARLFEPFVQGDDSTTRTAGGTGLGLSLCRRMARLMGGEVGVVSEVGRGSVFWVTLRLDHAGPAAGSADDEPVEPALDVLLREYAGSSILVADDNPVNREVAVALLEAAGLVVASAEDGRHSVELARAHDFAMILLDLQMPVLNGIEAAIEIRHLPGCGQVPIVAMTASVVEEERAACLAAGMNGYLAKPVEPTVLYAKVLKWLRRARADGATNARPG